MVYFQSNGSNRINRINKGSWSQITIAFGDRYYIYAMYIFISLRANNCHPWWLVTGSIPVMTSYGHGFANSKMVCFSLNFLRF